MSSQSHNAPYTFVTLLANKVSIITWTTSPFPALPATY